MRRLELQRRYEEGQKLAAQAAAAEEEAAAAAAAAERRERAMAMRAVREANERRNRLRAHAQARIHLASVHSNRSVVLSHGWRPWRALVASARAGMDRAAAPRARALAQPVFDAWSLLWRRAAARRACGRALVPIASLQLSARFSSRSGLLALRRGVGRVERSVAAAQRALSGALLRRLWHGWALQARMTRDRRLAEQLRVETAAAERADVVRMRRGIKRWAQHAARRAFAERAAVCQAALWRKVNTWLDEP